MRKLFPAVLAMALLLSGCMYASAPQVENQSAYLRESILVVQNAVDQFHDKQGVLPIKNSTVDTPIYEKHLIDFKRLVDWKLLSRIPTVAFENGGTFIFVIVNAEQKPEVKVLDLVAYQKTNDLQSEVDGYRNDHSGDLPAGERVGNGFYRLDFAKLGKQTEQVKSPYSNQYLGFILNESGRVYIDYAPEIARLLSGQSQTPPDADTDLRSLLVDQYPFVPAKSPLYILRNGEPVPSESN